MERDYVKKWLTDRNSIYWLRKDIREVRLYFYRKKEKNRDTKL